jgi:hypothetical protein
VIDVLGAVLGPLALIAVIAGEVIARVIAARQLAALWCRCGHGRDVHQHYTSSTYCSRCRCGRFRFPRKGDVYADHG